MDRGLLLLEIVAAAPGPLSLAALSERIGLHRSIVYRLLCTLQDHRMVAHSSSGYVLGTRSQSLGRRVLPSIQDIAKPEVAKLAARTGLTAFFAVRDGDEAVTLVSVEVQAARSHVVYSPGARHPLVRGAPGIVILAAGGPRAGERSEVRLARERGYAMTRGEVVKNLTTMAVAVLLGPEVALGAIAIAFDLERPSEDLLEAVRQAAAVMTNKLHRELANGLVLPNSP